MPAASLGKKLMESIKVMQRMCTYLNKTTACLSWNLNTQIWEKTQTK